MEQVVYIDNHPFTSVRIDYKHEESFTDPQSTVSRSAVGHNLAMIDGATKLEYDLLKELSTTGEHEIKFSNEISFTSPVMYIQDTMFYVTEK